MYIVIILDVAPVECSNRQIRFYHKVLTFNENHQQNIWGFNEESTKRFEQYYCILAIAHYDVHNFSLLTKR